MALHQSPRLVTDGLVFAYDMSNTKRSWKGAPVTNSFNCPNPYDANNNVGFIINGTGTFQRVYSGTYGGYTITPEDVVYRYNLGDGGCHYHGNSAAISAGQYVCYSVDYYVSPDASDYPTNNQLVTLENYGGSALSGSTGVSTDVTTKGKWQTIQGSYGPTGGSGTQAMFLYPGGCGGAGSYIASRGFILMKNPMFEFRSDVMYNRFVNGTRSNTESIKDLTNNNTITATSLTYTSDGAFSFDGGSNYLTIPNTTLGNGNVAWTVSCWMKTTTTTNSLGGGSILSNISGGPVYSMMGVNNGKIVYWTYQNNNWAQKLGIGKTVNDGNWHMLTWVNYSNYTMDMYVDGVLDSNVANSTSGNNNPVDVIGRSWAGYFPGSIPTLIRYNRELSAAEVQQNFNALKGRYGL